VRARESRGSMEKSFGTLALGRLLIAASSIALVACASALPDSEVPNDVEATTALIASAELDELTEKQRQYEQIFREARQQGLVSGGLRGALVGALISGEGAGAAAGAILGAIIGSSYSVVAAEKLLQEREEFLNRQAIVDNVLNAARSATDQTERDAQIVSSAVEKYSKYSYEIDAATRQKVSAATVTVSRAVELRALVIEESLQEATISENDAQEIRLLLNRQIDALTRIRALQNTWNSEANE
jgi:uncharacterized membrane protein